MADNTNSPDTPSSGPKSLKPQRTRKVRPEEDLATCQARVQSLQASNNQWMRNNTIIQEENARLRAQLASRAQYPPVFPPPQVVFHSQATSIATLQSQVNHSQQLNRTLTNQLQDANRDARKAKDTLEYERGNFINEFKSFEKALSEKDNHILSLLAELETKDVEMELLRQDCKETIEAAELSQTKLQQLQAAKDETDQALASAAEELALEQKEHGKTKEELADALKDLDQERSEHYGTTADLQEARDDLNREKRRHDEAKINLQDCENKLGFGRYVWEFAAKIRLRWLYSNPGSRLNKYEIINEGNRAAHDANIIVDLALLSLGKIDHRYRNGLQSLYGIDFDPYLCDYAKTKQLKVQGKSTELINLKASMSQDMRENTPAAVRFRELLGELDVIRARIEERYQDDGEREKAFEDDGSVLWIIKEMRVVVSNRDRDRERGSWT